VIIISEKDRLLRVRDQKNKKRPAFLRSEWHRLKRLQTSWRSPKGIDSKMRKKLKGKRKSPMSGYRNPKLVRGLHPSGKEIVRVFNTYDLDEIDTDNQIAQIGSKVGSRKRTAIINYGDELDIHIINPQIRRDFEDFAEDEELEDATEFEEVDDDELLLEDASEGDEQ